MSASSNPERLKSSKIAALDGIRGLAILMVLISHCLTQPIREAIPVAGTWQHHLWGATRLFYTGVDLFFVLSGFLICKVVMENESSKNLFKVFYVRRASRILPLYFIVLVGSIIAAGLLPKNEIWMWLFDNQIRFWSYLTLTQNYLIGLGHSSGNALSVTWSLCVEEQFYLVLPACIRFLPARILPWLFASGLPIAYLLRMHWHDQRSYTWSPSRADALLLGCLLAWISLQPSAMSWLRKQTAGVHLISVFLFLGLLYINRMPEYFGEAGHSWLAVFYGSLIMIAVTQPNSWITRILQFRGLCFLGTVSYGLYLLHRPVQATVHGLLQGTVPRIVSVSDLIYFPMVAGITLGAAYFSYRFFETWFLQMSRKLQFK